MKPVEGNAGDPDITILDEHRHDFSYDVGGSLCDTWPDALRAYVENFIYGNETGNARLER